jgi:hypothetical protein
MRLLLRLFVVAILAPLGAVAFLLWLCASPKSRSKET